MTQKEIPNDRILRTLKWALSDLCAEWGVDPETVILEVGQARRDICQQILVRRNENGKRVYRKMHREGRVLKELLEDGYQVGHRLRFGWQSLRNTYLNGFREYVGLQHLVKGRTNGLKGVEYAVRHEFAHALTDLMDERVDSKPHGPEFVEHYTAILESWLEWQE